MRFIYVDEAGTAINDPVTVVAAVVVEADSQYAAVERRLQLALTSVPEQHRERFVCHASAIWNDKRLRDGWRLEDRLTLLQTVAAIPKEVGVPLCLAFKRRGSADRDAVGDHQLAFGLCVAHADFYLRKHARQGEVAVVVAEHIPEMHARLRGMAGALRVGALNLSEAKGWARDIDENGNLLSESELTETAFTITRMKDTVHFVSKEDGPLLQIADVCAFGFRRYLAQLQFGDELFQSMSADPIEFFESSRSGLTGSILIWRSEARTPTSLSLLDNVAGARDESRM